MTDYKEYNERFLKLLSFYLYSADKMIGLKDYNAVKGCGVDGDTAFALLLAEGLGVDTEKEKEFFREYFIPSVRKLEVSDYYEDEFYKTVLIDGCVSGDVSLTYLTQQAFQGFVRDDFSYYPNGKVVARIGFFEEDYLYPAVKKGGVEWMTLLPNEINSQKKYISAAFGNVLCYGLGLGYYAFHVAKKPNVSGVTVVDIDGAVIDVFNKNILPHFPKNVAEKIKIIKADAFSFAETLKDGEFDYIYADIWRDAGDGVELYLKFKESERFSPSSKYGYWIEDTIKYYL